jgi:hypothetical protein
VEFVLLQKNAKGPEHPISFFCKELGDAKIKYDIMEKKAYDLVKTSNISGSMSSIQRSLHMFLQLL